MSDTLRINNLFTTSIGYSTLTGSTITTNSLSLSTLTVSSINSGAPGVAAYSTLNVSTLNATSTITASTITTTSNVGVGTNAPANLLDVSGSSTVLARFQSTADYGRIVLDGPSGGDIIYKTGGVSKWGIACISNHLQFLLNDSPSTVPVTFTSGGNVGIGITNPTYPFSVAGTIQAINTTNDTMGLFSTTYGGYLHIGAWTASGASAKNIVMQQLGGNVGIGITNPGYLLDVNGTLNIRGSFTVNGVAVATGTGSVWTVGASNAIYYSAGNTCLYRNRLIFSNAINDFNHSIYNNNSNWDSEGAWDGMKFNVFTGAWFRVGNAAGATPTTAMYINTSGYVGIGTTTVSYPLVVWTSGGAYSPGGNNPYIISPTISVQNTSGYGIVSGWFQKDVIAGGAVGTFSDLRIKNNVQPITNALETIDRLEMVSHGYIDHVQNRQSCSFGLIAQQVKHIVPDAVLLTTDYIPDIMCTPLTSEVDGDHVILTFDHPVDLAVNNLLRLILKDRQVEQKVSYVSQDQTVIHVSAWSNPDPIHDQIFVYGKQVDDFHILDKPKMGLLALAGVKELIKQNAEQAEKITTLESQLSTVLSRLNAAGIA